MSEEKIKINKLDGSITFINNGISFSQFGIAKEILDLITNLQQKVEQQEKEIDRLNKEYERIYNENCKLRENHNINDITLLDENERLNNIINELEKWLEDNLGNCRTNQNYTSNQIYNLKEDIYYRCLDKLKALKEE